MISRSRVWKVTILFAVVLLVYLGLYRLIEHTRNRLGPWEVTFTTNQTGRAFVLVNQSNLGLTNFTIDLPGSAGPTNGPATLRFTDPKRVPLPLPIGECLFLDTTTLPGTVVMRLSGHEVELLTRTLVLDGKEVPWSVGGIKLQPK